MVGFIIFCFYLFSGWLIIRACLPDQPPLIRGWLGLSLGILLLMWLPALMAFFVRFTLLCQWMALGLLCVLDGLALLWRWRHKKPLTGLMEADRGMIIALVAFVLPLTLLMAYLQHTHTLRNVEGALHVGQSTYGDLCMHLSIVTGLRGSALPAEYIILPGAPLGYPLLTDAMGTSLYLLGMPLRWTLILPGIVMSGLVFAGYLLFAKAITGKTSLALLAGVFLFFNGGLGFLYDFDLAGSDLSRIQEIFTGYYKTPANQPEFNLRWSNLIVDLLLPQRTFLGGWALLLPGLYCAREGFVKRNIPMFLMAALFGAALPLTHTHSFVGLALYSAGAFLCAFFSLGRDGEALGKERKTLLLGTGLYVAIVLCLALPQVIAFTLRQATNEGFISFHYNWVNRENGMFKDFPLWFWLKNIGLPLIAMFCAYLDFGKKHRMELVGGALIFFIANFIQFQPLAYDNNKLFYIWYLLALPSAAAFLGDVWQGLSKRRSAILLAVLFILGSTLSGGLSIAREVGSDYQLFSPSEVAVADYIEENTAPDSLFITGTHHNNTVYALAGRKVLCGPSLFLYFHGLNFAPREQEVKAFYQSPEDNLSIISAYGVDYIVLGWPERMKMKADEAALDRLFPIIFEEEGIKIYAVNP